MEMVINDSHGGLTPVKGTDDGKININNANIDLLAEYMAPLIVKESYTYANLSNGKITFADGVYRTAIEIINDDDSNSLTLTIGTFSREVKKGEKWSAMFAPFHEFPFVWKYAVKKVLDMESRGMIKERGRLIIEIIDRYEKTL